MIVAGEQISKVHTASVTGKDKKARFASFIPPGRYSVNHPWEHEYEKIAKLEKAVIRKVKAPQSEKLLDEIELVFQSSRNGERQKLIISGIDLEKLPALSVKEYPKGLYMPMGIGVPPFYQSYEALKTENPSESPYFGLLLDEKDRWINHHETAIDGPVLHRDASNPNLIHLYLLSYERMSLVAHFLLMLN